MPRRGHDSIVGASPGPGLRALRLALLVHLAAETWAWAVHAAQPPEWLRWALAAAYTVTLAIGLAPRRSRQAAVLASCLLAFHIVWTFPFTANHRLLLLFVVGCLALFDVTRHEEARSCAAALRAATVVVLFQSGVQKLLYGTYFKGQYLAYLVSREDRFAGALGFLIPTDDLSRLRAIDSVAPGAGPFLVDSPWFVALANGVWVLELGLAVLLAMPRTRRVAVGLALLLFLGMEAGAREFFFGLLFVQLLLLFLGGEWNRRLLPLFVSAYVLLVVVRVWIAPSWFLN